MAFRRPKKPVRPRVVILNADSEEDEAMEVDPPATGSSKNGHSKGKLSFDDEVVTFNKPKKNKEKDRGEEDKSSKTLNLLSFDDDGDGEEEAFQVKKSSVSRRLMKQRDKEKKGPSSSSSKSKSSFGSSNSKPLSENQDNFRLLSQVDSFASHIKIKEEPIIKIKTERDDKSKDFMRVLNGREAEALHMESEDDEEEEEENEVLLSSSGHKFRRPAAGGAGIQDAVRRALEQGQIPDANLIHEARKRKQMARDMGTGAEFVPVDNVDRFRNEKGRLVREDDDNDQSDEERIDFSSATNAAKIEREKRIDEFNAAQDDGTANDSDGEIDEWESQQIRKGVSQFKMQNVVKEMYQQGYMDHPSSQQSFMSSGTRDAHTGFGFYPPTTTSNTEPKKKGKTQTFVEQTQKIASIEEVINGSKKVTPELIVKQMADRLERLERSREQKAGELSRVLADLQLAEKELDEANQVKDGLNSRFIMYQNLRGYVDDLVDCLRCKIPEVENLEQRMIDLLKSRREKFSERRRQDVRDQTEEVAATVNIMGGNPVTKPPPSNPERTRRAAEREGRRTRRRRLREKEMKDVKAHKEGLSSDDEEPEIEFKAYFATRENILGEKDSVFEEVHEDFGTVVGILSRFEEWRENDFDSYKESYAYMCLPKCIAPLIRLNLISWDPLRESCDFMKNSWMRSLLSFSYLQSESIEGLTVDPDSRLVPSAIEKVVIPWINRVVEARWDPISSTQTRLLVNVLNRLIDDYSISPNNKPMHSLMETVIARLKDSLENDIYVPIYPKSAIANSFTPASVFISRQFWSSVKLLDNMSKWQGLLNDRPLQALALDALLTRYTLLGLRVASDLSESVERAKGVVNVLPRAWLAREGDIEIPNGLQQFSRCLVSLVQTSDCTTAANRIAIPDIASVLKTIGFNEEAQIILRKYS